MTSILDFYDVTILPEAPRHAGEIDSLLDTAFGPDRTRKTAYRLRDGVAPAASLCLVAEDADGHLVGTLRFWPVTVGGKTLLLLGPIAVEAGQRSAGIGSLLMREGLARAAAEGWEAVILVGDEPYYARFGFRRALAESLSLPGPVDPARFLALELVPGALDGVAGMVGKAVPAATAGRGAPCPDRDARRVAVAQRQKRRVNR